MKKFYNKNNKNVKNIKIFPFLLILATIFMSIGYASITSINLEVDTQAKAEPVDDSIIITNVSILDGDGTISNTKLNKAIMKSTISLNQDNNSFITLKVTVHNNKNHTLYYKGLIYDTENNSKFYDNDNIIVNVDNKTLKIAQPINPSEDIEFNITFNYKNKDNISNNILNSYIKFDFNDKVMLRDYDTSKITSKNSFVLANEADFNLNDITFYAKIDTSKIDINTKFQNLISTGVDISNYYPSAGYDGVNLHLYYPLNDNNKGKIEVDLTYNSSKPIHFLIPLYSEDNGMIKVAMSKYGIYLNGRKVADKTSPGELTTITGGNFEDSQIKELLETFFTKLENNSVNITTGSVEGTNRSTAKYNCIGFYAGAKNTKELAELTKLDDSDEEKTFELLNTDNIEKGKSFDLGSRLFDTNTQTLVADIDISDIAADRVNENILSIGTKINSWSSDIVNLHMYYTANGKNLIIAPILNGYTFPHQYTFTLDDNAASIKLAFNKYGLYINGKLIFNDNTVAPYLIDKQPQVAFYLPQYFEKWNSLVSLEKNIQIGSLEGTSRSTATYNSIKIYSSLLSSNEMIDMTT